MKDIDFDELDKAVNSLMGKNAQKEATPNTPAAPPVKESDMPLTAAPVSPGTIKPKSEVATNPDTQPAIVPPQSSQSQTASPARSGMPASRRSGRFMDVVPKKPTQQQAPSRPTSREGVTIAPRPDVEPSTVSSTPAASLPIQPTTPVSSTPETTPSVPEAAAPASDWPDPIDMHSFAKQKQEPTPMTPPVSEKPEETPEKQSEEEQKPADQPLSSPFLPDAKVEKRPLGSAAPMIPMVAPEHELQAATPDDSEAQLPAKPSDVQEPPEEFRGDLMQVEADTHMGVPKTDQTHPIDEKPEDEKSVSPDLSTSEKSSETKETSKPVEVSTAEDEKSSTESHVGRISIPQQYKEQPSSGEKESGAIYDTDTYHQPLAHPAKKKSGWLWVLWIVLILIVGAGAGMALYFLGIM